MNYQNFDLEIISSQESKQLSARVLDSPQGDSPFLNVSWPFTADEETGFLDEIYGGLRQRRVRPTKMTTVQDFGGRLFDAVFTGDIAHLFRASLDASFREGKGLRIRLRLPEESELHARPWEFLFDTETREFLAVREHTPLVRYLPVAQPILPIAVDGPLRILVALAAPTDHPRLDVAHEWEILHNALESSVLAGQVELRRVPGRCTFDNLRDSLRHFGAHIFHFVGHGVPGALVLEHASGKGFEMEATQLRSAFPGGTLPRLVVLNSCSGTICEDVPFSGLAQGFLRRGVPAVVAMQASITDDAALIFTRYFYRDLLETGAVDTSLTEARLRMKANGHPLEWGTPVLYMRAPNGQLFQPRDTLDDGTVLARGVPLKESIAARMVSGWVEKEDTRNLGDPSLHAPPDPLQRRKPRDETLREPATQVKTEPRDEPDPDEPAVTLHGAAKEPTATFIPEPKREERTIPLAMGARKFLAPIEELGLLDQRLYRGWPLAGLALVFVVTVISVSALLSKRENPALPATVARPATSLAPAPAPSSDSTVKRPVVPTPVPEPVLEPVRVPALAPLGAEPVKLPVAPSRTDVPARLAQEPAPAAPTADGAKPAGAAKRKAPVQQQASRKPPATAASGNCRNPNVSERSVECLFSK